MLIGRKEALLATSVRMNGLHVPFNRVIESFSRFCRPLTIANRGSSFELSSPGSAFAIRYLGINFVVASLHQFNGYDPREYVMIDADRSGSAIAIPPVEILRPSLTQASGVVPDICLMRFPDVRDGRDIKAKFFQLESSQVEDQDGLPHGSQIVAHVTCGFPVKDQIFEPFWNEATFEAGLAELRSRWSRYFLENIKPNVWDEPGLKPYVIDEEQMRVLQNPDGLSGSPIVTIWQDANLQAHFSVSGMVLRGSLDGRINALPARWLKQVLSNGAEAARTEKAGSPRG